VTTALSAVQRRLIVSREELELPAWVHNQAEVRRRVGRLLDLQRMREALEVRLRHCAECFSGLLPPDRPPAGSKTEATALSEGLSLLRRLPGPGPGSETAEQRLEDACSSVQASMVAAMDRSRQEQPLFSAMRHSMEFAELLARLAQTREGERQLQQELQVVAQDYKPGKPGRKVSKLGLKGSMPPRRLASTSLGPAPALDEFSTSSPSEQSLDPGPTPTRTMQRSRSSRLEADFGFRPDGLGETSLENWPLFKVNRASEMSTAAATSGVLSYRSSSTSFLRDLPASQARRQRNPGGDFSEYVSRSQQGSIGPRSSAACSGAEPPEERQPESSGRRTLSLPQLVGVSRDTGSPKVDSSLIAARARKARKAAVQAVRDVNFAQW